MNSLEEVKAFLASFHDKRKRFDILFMEDVMNNTALLLSLDISAAEKREIIESVVFIDYAAGPVDDEFFGKASTWLFGKHRKQQEFSIKLTIGVSACSVACVSFAVPEEPLTYPFKK